MNDAIIRVRDDLLIQAMMFDMDIDWEALELVEKKKTEVSKKPWLDKWLIKQSNADYMQDGSDDQEYDDDGR